MRINVFQQKEAISAPPPEPGRRTFGASHEPITLGIYGFPENTRRMTLLHAFAGVSLEEIQENSSFPIDVDPNWSYLPDPTPEELNVLHQLDPHGIVLT